jgi:competence/damage-inducible protein CinA-like protein
MQAEIVAIGTELLLGEIVDTNSTHIARTLRDIGLDVLYMSTVGDNEKRVADVLRTALGRADVVITTGGLGPTVDDVTRQAVAVATERPLEFKQELLDQIAARFGRFGAKMGENNRQQAFVPKGAIAIENPVGTAPVFIVDDSQGIVIALPGVPREMKHLLESDILPWLKDRLGLEETIIKARILRTAGIGESRIDQKITDLMKASNPTVGLAAHTGQVDVRITAKASSEGGADALIVPVEQELRQRLGATIYGTGDLPLEDALVALCAEAGLTLASCEAGVGDKLVERLTQAAAETNVYTGGSSLEDDVALTKHLSLNANLPVTELAEAAANSCRAEKKSTLGIATVLRPMQDGDPEGFGGTAIAVATTDGVRSHYYAFGTDRLNAPTWASTQALAMARNTVLKYQT